MYILPGAFLFNLNNFGKLFSAFNIHEFTESDARLKRLISNSENCDGKLSLAICCCSLAFTEIHNHTTSSQNCLIFFNLYRGDCSSQQLSHRRKTMRILLLRITATGYEREKSCNIFLKLQFRWDASKLVLLGNQKLHSALSQFHRLLLPPATDGRLV